MAEIDEVREKFLDTQKTKKKNINDEEDNRWGCWSSKRYFLTAMLFMGAFSIRSIGGNMSIAIIAMTQNRTMIVDNQTIQYEPEFQWNSKMQGLVLSMPGYGYLFSIVAGIAVKKFGGVTTYGWSLLMMGVLSILNPYIARLNYHLLLFGKLLEGLGENWTIVSTIEIWSQWMPKIQRSSLMSIGYTGSYFAQAFNFPICGFLTSFYGWPSTFYYTGGMAVIVSLIILSSFSDDPSCDRYISKKELKMIMRDKEHSSNEKVAYFWKPMLTMKPLWALLVLKIAYASGFSFITICFPLYVKDMTGKKIDQIGIFSGIPNTASIFTVPLFGTLADYLRNKKILNDPQVHRTYVLVACIFGAMCLFAVSFISNFTINIIILMLFKILLSLIYVTKVIYPIYLAPRHSSSVTAITSYGFTFGCTITPMLIGYVVTSHQPYQWNICISAIGAAMLIASTIFVSFAARKVPDIFRDVPQHKNERSIEHLS